MKPSKNKIRKYKRYEMDKEPSNKKSKNKKEDLSFKDYSNQVENMVDYSIIPPISCDTSLRDFCPEKDIDDTYLTLDFLWYNLPVLNYIIRSIVSFIFSNNLTTGDEEETKILHEFLREKNINGVPNELVLKTAISYGLLYGQSGIRWLSKKDGIDYIKYNRIGVLTYEDDFYKAVRTIKGYVIARDKDGVSKNVTVSFANAFNEQMENAQRTNTTKPDIHTLVSDDGDYIYLPKDEMVNLRDNVAYDNGEPILYHDRQRIQLIATVYDRLIKDLENEGFGRVLLYPKSNIFDTDETEKSASEVMRMSSENWDKQIDVYKKEIMGFIHRLVNSKSDSVSVMPNNIKDHKVIEKQVKSTDFLDFITVAGETIAQVFGINPALVGLGKLSGNVSMNAILDNSMKNIIIPLRESLIVQISNMLSPKLGIGEIYFEDYENEFIEEEDKHYKIMSEIIVNLRKAGMDSHAETLANEKFNHSVTVTKPPDEVTQIEELSLLKKIFGGNK